MNFHLLRKSRFITFLMLEKSSSLIYCGTQNCKGFDVQLIIYIQLSATNFNLWSPCTKFNRFSITEKPLLSASLQNACFIKRKPWNWKYWRWFFSSFLNFFSVHLQIYNFHFQVEIVSRDFNESLGKGTRYIFKKMRNF